MGENHLTYFKIENFKRFDSFEMENIGQFNLLVGDNNVGKTSVLEGLLFNEDGITYLHNLHTTLFLRKSVSEYKHILNEDYWKLLMKNTLKPMAVSFINNKHKFQTTWSLILNKDLKKNDWQLMSREGYINSPDFFTHALRFTSNYIKKDFNFFPLLNRTVQELESKYESYTPFIPINRGYDIDLLDYYYKQINPDKNNRKEFQNNLKVFIPKLEEVRTQKFFNDIEVISVVLEDENGIFPITRFGEGTIKLTRILLEILMAKGKRLMIDEIETGIHFSRLKDFWKTVITLCKKYDVQLFATTHSLECQRYFVDALAELKEEDRKNARNITMIENHKGEIKAITSDYEQFEFALSIGANTRGGQR